jgi:hypothetical protein
MTASAPIQLSEEPLETTRVVPDVVIRELARSSMLGAYPRVVIEAPTVIILPDPRTEPDEVRELDRVLYERLFARDREGAMDAAEAILKLDSRHRAARLARKHCRIILEARYRAAVGSFVPRALAGLEQLTAAAGDCGTAFAFALKAGAGDLPSLLSTSALPSFETLRALHRMVAQGLIERRERAMAASASDA